MFSSSLIARFPTGRVAFSPHLRRGKASVPGLIIPEKMTLQEFKAAATKENKSRYKMENAHKFPAHAMKNWTRRDDIVNFDVAKSGLAKNVTGGSGEEYSRRPSRTSEERMEKPKAKDVTAGSGGADRRARRMSAKFEERMEQKKKDGTWLPQEQYDAKMKAATAK